MRKVEPKIVWQSLNTLQEQLDSIKKDVPVTRQEFADVLNRVNDMDFSVKRMNQVVKEQYAAGIKTGLTAAAIFGCVTGVVILILSKLF